MVVSSSDQWVTREELRAKFTDSEMFKLSNMAHEFSVIMNGLCSEKAREINLIKIKQD